MAHIIDIDALTPTERLDLIEELWNSFLAEPESMPFNSELLGELDRRMEAYDRDPNGASSWEDVRARILWQQ